MLLSQYRQEAKQLFRENYGFSWKYSKMWNLNWIIRHSVTPNVSINIMHVKLAHHAFTTNSHRSWMENWSASKYFPPFSVYLMTTKKIMFTLKYDAPRSGERGSVSTRQRQDIFFVFTKLKSRRNFHEYWISYWLVYPLPVPCLVWEKENSGENLFPGFCKQKVLIKEGFSWNLKVLEEKFSCHEKKTMSYQSLSPTTFNQANFNFPKFDDLGVCLIENQDNFDSDHDWHVTIRKTTATHFPPILSSWHRNRNRTAMSSISNQPAQRKLNPR